MPRQRKKHGGAFKTKVVLSALRGDKTMSEISSIYGVHSTQISQWKKHVLEELPKVLSDRRSVKEKEYDKERAALYEQIGELTMDIKWLKKKVEI